MEDFGSYATLWLPALSLQVAIDLIGQHIQAKLGTHDLRKIYPNLYIVPSTFQVSRRTCQTRTARKSLMSHKEICRALCKWISACYNPVFLPGKRSILTKLQPCNSSKIKWSRLRKHAKNVQGLNLPVSLSVHVPGRTDRLNVCSDDVLDASSCDTGTFMYLFLHVPPNGATCRMRRELCSPTDAWLHWLGRIPVVCICASRMIL